MNKVQGKLTRGAMLLLSFVCMLTLTGCFGVDGQFRHLRDVVMEGTQVEYTIEAEFGIGTFFIGLVSRIVEMSDDEDAEIAQSLLKQIKRVQIGTYKLENFDLQKKDVHRKTMEIVAYMKQHEYDSIIRNYENGGASLIMVRMNPNKPDRISDFVVLDFDRNELNLVQLKGDLAEILDIAIQEGEVPGMEEAIEESFDQ
jgi:hypothetical protein